jgi:hypothetical protein
LAWKQIKIVEAESTQGLLRITKKKPPPANAGGILVFYKKSAEFKII